MFSTDDTITAVATPPGRGGIGVVRISGGASLAVARHLLSPGTTLEPRLATFATLRAGQAADADAIADQVVCTFFPSPRSYTGEDVIEISAHGSPLLLGRIVDEATRVGARLARPGEFTFRAYLNGRLDLVQAEAVADLIEAVTPTQARAAFAQLDGTLTQVLRGVRDDVFDLVARLEACLDFPDEDYHFLTRSELLASLARIQGDVRRLLSSSQGGRVLREGALVVISGRPNVGKSSLFNALVGSSRAIVSAEPGTTRDLVTERCDVGGVPVTFVDTAGVRETLDVVEREGVERARQASEVAAVRLVVLDRSKPLTREDAVVMEEPGRRVVVLNKADLPAAWSPDRLNAWRREGDATVSVSARTGLGLDELREVLCVLLTGAEHLEAIGITNLRHARLLEDVESGLTRALQSARSGASEEFVVADLQWVIGVFDQITHHGAASPEIVLEAIFSRFCIGK